MALDKDDDTDFVKFWNTVLEPKFTKYRHILQGGLSRRSAAVIPKLPLEEGMSVLDVGCGWGDMSLQVAEIVGPKGRVLGIDCVDAFLEEGRKDGMEQDRDDGREHGREEGMQTGGYGEGQGGRAGLRGEQ